MSLLSLGGSDVKRAIKYLNWGYAASIESLEVYMEDTNTNINVNEENNTSTPTPGATEETKTYTAEEVAKLVQAESDRRTNQALAKQKKEFEKKLSLSSLDEQQRKEAEAQMKIQELQEQLAAFQIEKNRSEIKSVLAARGLDSRFADIINISDDLEASQKNIELLDKIVKASVKAEVEKRLAGTIPKGNGNGSAPFTRENAKKMSLAELAKLKKANPEYYKSLYN